METPLSYEIVLNQDSTLSEPDQDRDLATQQMGTVNDQGVLGNFHFRSRVSSFFIFGESNMSVLHHTNKSQLTPGITLTDLFGTNVNLCSVLLSHSVASNVVCDSHCVPLCLLPYILKNCWLATNVALSVLS